MNCKTAKAQLLDDLNNELRPEDSHQLHQHLAACEACRQEQEQLRFVLEAVQLTQAPTVQVSPEKIYREAAGRAKRESLRWRRACWALGLIAASLLIALLGTNLNVRWEQQQLMISWGEPIPMPSGTVVVHERDSVPEQINRQQQQIHHLVELTQALRAEQLRRDLEHQKELMTLRARVQDEQQDSLHWRAEMERQFRGLYELCLVNRKGDLP